MVQNQAGQNQVKLQPVSLAQWRTARRESERRVESVNRILLNRQHAN